MGEEETPLVLPVVEEQIEGEVGEDSIVEEGVGGEDSIVEEGVEGEDLIVEEGVEGEVMIVVVVPPEVGSVMEEEVLWQEPPASRKVAGVGAKVVVVHTK